MLLWQTIWKVCFTRFNSNNVFQSKANEWNENERRQKKSFKLIIEIGNYKKKEGKQQHKQHKLHTHNAIACCEKLQTFKNGK